MSRVVWGAHAPRVLISTASPKSFCDTKLVGGSSPAMKQSVIGRLLEEISWTGSQVKAFRGGGRGFENVLTAEVFQALDFLPRTSFLGNVIESAHGAVAARAALRQEAETAEFHLLPGEMCISFLMIFQRLRSNRMRSSQQEMCTASWKQSVYARVRFNGYNLPGNFLWRITAPKDECLFCF